MLTRTVGFLIAHLGLVCPTVRARCVRPLQASRSSASESSLHKTWRISIASDGKRHAARLQDRRYRQHGVLRRSSSKAWRIESGYPVTPRPMCVNWCASWFQLLAAGGKKLELQMHTDGIVPREVRAAMR